MSTLREGVAYLQVRPHPSASGRLIVVKSTQKPPSLLEPGCVVIKLRVRIPARAFLPLAEAIVTVPESLVQHPIEIEAVDPS